MATFPSIAPTYPLKKRTRAKTFEADFGDGYVMRQPDGINNIRPSYEVVFEKISEADKNTITAFLESQKGSISFDWTPPGGTAAKWVCDQWEDEYAEYGQFNVRATFTRSFS